MFSFLRSRPPEIDVEELDRRIVAGSIHVIDVREPHEWAAGHVGVAKHIPLRTLPAKISTLKRDRTIAVICQSGTRSAQAVDFLVEQGLDAVSVRGGTGAWIRSGRLVVR